MFYRVTARFKPDTAAELRRRLDDGSLAAQQPDGQEIVESLHRAVMTESGDVEWSETCYCPTPLAHERATVLNHHFDDIVTESIAGYEEYEGTPFIAHVRMLASDSAD